MMKSIQHSFLLWVVLFGLSSMAWSTTYYVDTVSGTDSNAGTSAAAPWQTVAKVNATSFNPGDSVLFKRGDIWREQLSVSSAGSPNSPITFADYGTGAKPIISGADLVTGWSLYYGNVYQAPAAYAPRIVVRDGLLLTPVTSIANLSADGEWFYDGSTTLYLFSPTNPAAHTIAASHRAFAVSLGNVSYVTLRNLYLEYANNANLGISAWGLAIGALTISGVDSDRAAGNGIICTASVGGTINGLTIANTTDTHSGVVGTGGNGIDIGYISDTGISNVTLSNVHSAFYGAPDNPALTARVSAFGLNLAGVTNATLTNVEVDHAGAAGLALEHGTNHVTVTGGSMHDNGQSNIGDMDGISIGDDGNGTSYLTIHAVNVYSNNGNGVIASVTSSGQVSDHVTVAYCQIHGNRGDGYWNDGGHTNQLLEYNLISNNAQAGIYLIQNSYGSPGIQIYGNTVYGNGTGGTVTANICINSSGAVFKNNVVAQAVGGEIYLGSGYTLISDYNDWYHSAGGNFMYYQGNAYDFAGWQSHSGQDAHSLSVDPQFVSSNPSGPNDFKLRPTSPLIGAGANLGTAYENALDLQSANFPYSLFNQNLSGQGWGIGAFCFRQSFVVVVE